MADGSEKGIEKVQVGEKVRTFDEVTGAFTTSAVAKAFEHDANDDYIVEMRLSNGRTLNPNARHLIFANGRYQSAGDIALQRIKGERVVLTGLPGKSSPHGTPVELLSVSVKPDKVKLYNLHVSSPYDGKGKESTIGHNYVAEGVVVHNLKYESGGGGTVCYWAQNPGEPGRVNWVCEEP